MITRIAVSVTMSIMARQNEIMNFKDLQEKEKEKEHEESGGSDGNRKRLLVAIRRSLRVDFGVLNVYLKRG